MTRSLAHLIPLDPGTKTLGGEASLSSCSAYEQCRADLHQQHSFKQSHCPCLEAPSNFGVKLPRPGAGPAAELPSATPA
jgi:hypothetical protein